MRPEGAPVGRKLARTSKAVGAAFNAALAAEGGSLSSWLILSALAGGPRPTQLHLARALGIEGPTINRHLENLERAGYVTRRRSPVDRRATVVDITPAGEEARRRMLGAVIAFNRRLHAGISRDELRLLDGLLTRLAHNVGAPSAGSPERVGEFPP